MVDDRLWAINIETMSMGKNSVKFSENYMALVDTGTTGIAGSVAYFTELLDGYWKETYDCDYWMSLPDVQMTFGGSDTIFNISAEDYIVKMHAGPYSRCQPALMPTPFPDDFKLIILGDTLMTKYYVHFDQANKQIGFAPQVNPRKSITM